jgi:predicted Zn-dependent protease
MPEPIPVRRARPRAAALALVAAAAALAPACATNPVTGKRQLAFISEKDEIALGQQSAEQIKAQMGEYPDPKVQAYVSRVGLEMAKKSERPKLPWSFTVLDDPTVNAFALPGGPIFVTRGILTHMTSEAELAGVLGHEIGHITARHSVEQLSKQQLAQLGLGVGMVVSEDLRGMGEAAMAGLQLLFLKYGRDAERQSDELGFKYMVGQGYDPREMAAMFTTLQRASAAAGAGRVPEWASTHPDPGGRAEKALERASKLEGDLSRLEVRREPFVALLDGMVFGEDPRQGFMEGNTFLHPALKFRLDLPEGWKAQNLPSALVAVSPGQDAAFQLTVAGKLSPEEATRKFFEQEGVKPADLAGGNPPGGGRYFAAQTQQGVVGGLVTFVAHGGLTFQLLGYAPAEKVAAADPAFRKTTASFTTLTDPAALAVQPAKVELVKLSRDTTIEQFAAEHPSTVPPEVLALINGVAPGATLAAGTTAKRVVGGRPASPARASR